MSFHIVVKTPTDQRTHSIELDVGHHDLIADVKRKIQNKKGIQPNQQVLIFDGKKLKNNRSLSSYDITDQSILYLVIRNVQTHKL